MKKVRNLLITTIIAVCAAIACFAFAACGGNTDTALVGTYKFSSMTITMEEEGEEQTVTVKAGEEFNGVVITENYMKLELRADGTVTMSSAQAGEGGDGTWVEEHGVVKLTADGETIEATHSGKTLTIVIYEGMSLTLSK